RAHRKGVQPVPVADLNTLKGTWTYRAFKNWKTKDTSFNDLEFGRGLLHITQVDPQTGKVDGRLEIDDDGVVAPLAIIGTATSGQLISLRLTGTGTGATNRDWHYEYQGYQFSDALPLQISPEPSSIKDLGRRPVIVGQVVRAQTHPGSDPKTPNERG